MIRQAINRGPGFNLQTCWRLSRGKYALILCSDDAIESTFVERCVKELESHTTAGYAMVNRSIIDQDGNRREEPPFYDRSCLIPGHEQAAVYMMAALNPSVSQILYRKRVLEGCNTDFRDGGMGARWFGQRMQDFNICRDYDMIYINEPLLLHRVHMASDSANITDNLIELIGQYMLTHQFYEVARDFGMIKAAERLPAALVKLARNCRRYAARSRRIGNEQTATRLEHLALAIDPTSAEENIEADATGDEMTRGIIQVTNRKVSYEPPPGSIPL